MPSRPPRAAFFRSAVARRRTRSPARLPAGNGMAFDDGFQMLNYQVVLICLHLCTSKDGVVGTAGWHLQLRDW